MSNADTDGHPAVVPLDLGEMVDSPPPELDFVLPGLLKGSCGVMKVSPDADPSPAALTIAYSVGLGRDLSGGADDDITAGRCVYLSQEPTVLLLARLGKLRDLFADADEAALAAGNVDIIPMHGSGFRFMEDTPDGPLPSAMWISLVDALAANPPRLVIMDMPTRITGVDEDDRGQMGLILSVIEQTCLRVGCAFVLVHRDDGSRSGFSALEHDCPWVTRLVVDGEHGHRLDFERTNFAEPPRSHWYP